LPGWLLDLPAGKLPDIKTVHGSAAFGHDARGGNIQPLFGQSLRNRVEQTKPVLGLNFNQAAVVRRGVVEANLCADAFAQIGGVGRARGGLLCNQFAQINPFAGQHRFQKFGKFLALLASSQPAAAAVVHKKRVQHDAVGAGENLRA
jgi:hypothetical protein